MIEEIQKANIAPTLNKIASHRSLAEGEAEAVFDDIMSGKVSDIQLSALLLGLRTKGETIDEITGAAKALLKKANLISAPDTAIDTCGTGGDGAGTYNISTAVSLVVAACGIPVAKHGNRAVSSKSGAADVLEALGVNTNCSIETSEAALKDFGFCFLLAPNHHPAMRHVGPIRSELKTRTIFNLMGPLLNPARTKKQLVGVFSKEFMEPMALVLKALGTEKAWVVHGSDGLDEITTTGVTYVCELDQGEIRHFEINPSDLGLFPTQSENLRGGDASTNAEALTNLLEGEKGAYRDIVVLNSAAALVIAGQAETLKDGLEWARRAIDNGAAKTVLQKLITATQSEKNDA